LIKCEQMAKKLLNKKNKKLFMLIAVIVIVFVAATFFSQRKASTSGCGITTPYCSSSTIINNEKGQCESEGKYCSTYTSDSQTCLVCATEAMPASCADSDGGDVPATKGTATLTYIGGSQSALVDLCVGTTLQEAYCIGSGSTSEIDIAEHSCPNGCSNGACSAGPSPVSCVDSDGGAYPNVYGSVIITRTDGTHLTTVDSCSGTNSVTEQTCTGTSNTNQVISCPNGCNSGVCLSSGGADCLDAAAGNICKPSTYQTSTYHIDSSLSCNIAGTVCFVPNTPTGDCSRLNILACESRGAMCFTERQYCIDSFYNGNTGEYYCALSEGECASNQMCVDTASGPVCQQSTGKWCLVEDRCVNTCQTGYSIETECQNSKWCYCSNYAGTACEKKTGYQCVSGCLMDNSLSETAVKQSCEDNLPETPIQPATCFNGEKDSDETEKDCGGSCVACSLNCPKAFGPGNTCSPEGCSVVRYYETAQLVKEFQRTLYELKCCEDLKKINIVVKDVPVFGALTNWFGKQLGLNLNVKIETATCAQKNFFDRLMDSIGKACTDAGISESICKIVTPVVLVFGGMLALMLFMMLLQMVMGMMSGMNSGPKY
jgi:hypothetical protein